jgi:hypothetical protein
MNVTNVHALQTNNCVKIARDEHRRVRVIHFFFYQTVQFGKNHPRAVDVKVHPLTRLCKLHYL